MAGIVDRGPRAVSRSRAAALLASVLFLLCASGAGSGARPLGPPATSSRADPSLFIDGGWYAAALVDAVDRWNGGLDGTQGMGAYRPSFDGLFLPDVGADWKSLGDGPRTAVSQSRAIFLQTQALYALGDEAAAAAAGERFRAALEKGVAALVRSFRDRERGGYSWMVGPDGRVVDGDKQDYGNVHVLFALSHAAAALRDESVLLAAVDQFRTLRDRFIDPKYPGSIRPRLRADFKAATPSATNNVDSTLHGFEAYLALLDALDARAADRRAGAAWGGSLLAGEAAFARLKDSVSEEALGGLRAEVAGRAEDAGNFLAFALARPEAGHPDRLWISYNFDERWRPATEPYSFARQWSGARHASPGHGVELAYLLSRAVERGFPARWLEAGRALLAFAEAHALEPGVGAMRYDISEWDGSRLRGYALDGLFEWWPQAETARALMHYGALRDPSLRAEFKKTESFIRTYLIDAEYGGWYKTLRERKGGFEPLKNPKGSVWKTGYHAAMLYAEAIRLCRAYGEAAE
jgi:cellobiose epimerase